MVDMLLEVCDWRRIQWCFVTCFRRFCWRFSRCDPNHCGLSSMFFPYSYLRMYSFTMAYQRRNRKEMSPVNSLVRVIENVWRYLSFAPANVAAQLKQFLALWTAWLWGAIFGIKAITWWLLLYPGWHQSTTVSFARVLIRSGMESWSLLEARLTNWRTHPVYNSDTVLPNRAS